MGTTAQAAPAAAPRGAEGCIAQVATVDRDARLMAHDLQGNAKGAAVKVRGSDGRLGSKPKALAFAGEAGDPSGGERLYYAVTSAGRLNQITVHTTWMGTYKTKMTTKQLGRGFDAVALAAYDGIVDGDPAYIYIVDRKGNLTRRTYSDQGKLGRAALVAKGVGAPRSMSMSRSIDVKNRDGAKTTTADVLLLNDARSGALKEIVVPRSAPGKTRVSTLQRSGWGGYTQVQRLECGSDTRSGFVAVRANGTGVVFSDANMTDLSGRDIRKVGPVSGRFAR